LTIVILVGKFIMVSDSMADHPYKTTDAEYPCEIVEGTENLDAAEDITMVTDTIALLATDDRVKLWHVSEENGGGPENTPNGAIVELDLA